MITPANVVPASTAALAAGRTGAATFLPLQARFDNVLSIRSAALTFGERCDELRPHAHAAASCWSSPDDVGRFGSMTYDEFVEIARTADMSGVHIRDSARNCTNDAAGYRLVRLVAARIFYGCKRWQARDLLKCLANSSDRPMLESRLIDMVVMGEATAVRSLVTLFPGDWTTAFLKTAAREHPAIRQRLVEMSEEKGSLLMRVGWALGTLTSLPPPLAYLNPEI